MPQLHSPHDWLLKAEAQSISLQQGRPTLVSEFPGCFQGAESGPSVDIDFCILDMIDAS